MAKSMLAKAGFQQLSETAAWKTTPGGKYFVTRNGSSVVAFGLGSKWAPGSPAAIVGAHTDSPCLRLKPISKRSAEGYLQCGVETYGGGIWHTWFDRDLSLAGRVMVEEADGTFAQRLIKVDKPLLRIPNLAPHLDASRGDPFKINKETHLTPILGTIAAQMNAPAYTDVGISLQDMSSRHHPALISLLAAELKLKDAKQIHDFELVLYDTQPSCFGGLNDELIFSPRLDNLGCTFASVAGLIASLEDPAALEGDESVRIISCFDHEEVGSLSAQGADSNFLPTVLQRLNASNENLTAMEQCCAKSFLISADMAHAVNPNYTSAYESEHKPKLNEGVVLKVNANQRYMTNAPGIVLMQKMAELGKVKLQLFVVRQDGPCGSTIGPMLAGKLGIRTVDLGNPQLSMHSIRETGGTHDGKLFLSCKPH
jgi:aspartyl aminopeptidase